MAISPDESIKLCSEWSITNHGNVLFFIFFIFLKIHIFEVWLYFNKTVLFVLRHKTGKADIDFVLTFCLLHPLSPLQFEWILDFKGTRKFYKNIMISQKFDRQIEEFLVFLRFNYFYFLSLLLDQPKSGETQSKINMSNCLKLFVFGFVFC